MHIYTYTSYTCIHVYTMHTNLDMLEKEMATHSSVFAWRISGMGEPGGLPSMGFHRVGHNWSDLAAVAEREREIWNYIYQNF